MKIVIADPLPPTAADLLRDQGWTVDAEAGRPRPRLEADLADADALIVRSATRVDAGLLAAAPRLRIVARAGTGVDNVDLDAASANGILVVNAPGANSISVAEHTMALLLASARSVAHADAGLKAGRWEKKRLTGVEVRGKTLGVVGLGRIGREVVHRAHAFGMRCVAHDPFIAGQVAADLDVELMELDELCGAADFITLHVPATGPGPLFTAERLARCKPSARIVNTARGALVDQEALADAIEGGAIGGAGLDVFQVEPPPDDDRLVRLPQVVSTPHIAGSTHEAQELVGLETAACVRDYLGAGIVRNAVNYPSLGPEELKRMQPYTVLARRLGTLLKHIGEARPEALALRYYGGLAEGDNEPLVGASLVGFFGSTVDNVTPINARAVARDRGIEVIESRSSRPRNFTNLISMKLHTARGEHWVEGVLFEQAGPRLVLIDGVQIEAPLEGTLVVVRNDDQPGVIGEVGRILGRRGINIETFALGRGAAGGGAVAVVKVDRKDTDDPGVTAEVLDEIRAVPPVKEASVISSWTT